MVRLTRIYTGGGDKGETSLGDGSRVAKHDPRVAAYGTVDEANAVIGIARAALRREIAGLDTGAAKDTLERFDTMLSRIQNDLFDAGADLCNPPAGQRRPDALRVSTEQAKRLEQEIDSLNAELQPLTSFVLPGGTPVAAFLHQARTVVRRAEREVTALAAAEPVGADVVVYLNRLSDLLFVMARHANDRGASDVLWVPGANR